MKTNFIPRGDRPFLSWLLFLIKYIDEGGLSRFNIPDDEFNDLKAKAADFEAKLNAAEEPDTRTKATVMAKKESRTVTEKTSRNFVKSNLAYNPKVSDADRENMGIPVHDTKPTPAPDITTRPELEVGFSEIQKHTLIVRDSTAKGAGKPAHAAGFEVWRKVGGDAPATEADWQLVAQVPHSPCTLNYLPEQSGLRAYYRVRWVNTRGVPGPWSETVSAIIA